MEEHQTASLQHAQYPIMRLSFGVLLAGAILVVFSIQFEILMPSLNRVRDSELQNVPKSLDSSDLSQPPPPSRSSVQAQQTTSMTPVPPHPFIVDVLSTGSTSRWNYIITQQRKWGSHPSIRHFEGVNETHHELYNASCQGIKQQVLKCFQLKNTSKGKRSFYTAPGLNLSRRLFTKKSEGWMCAQHRPVIGLHSAYGSRYRSDENLPDWLLLVDDDTTIHMNVLEFSIASLDPEVAHVLVGKYIFYGWPLGGFGVALSRAAIRRFFLPIQCNSPSNTTSRDFQIFSRQFCQKTLRKNLIYERDEFMDGMSILDLMLAIQLHRKPFCWHSDWYMGWFLTNHVMLGQPLPRFPPCQTSFDCQPNGTVCELSTLMCHDKNKTKRFQNLMGSLSE